MPSHLVAAIVQQLDYHALAGKPVAGYFGQDGHRRGFEIRLCDRNARDADIRGWRIAAQGNRVDRGQFRPVEGILVQVRGIAVGQQQHSSGGPSPESLGDGRQRAG